MHLTTILKRLELIYARNNAQVLLVLQSGIPRADIDMKLKPFKAKLPEEVYELFQWRNGLIPEPDERLDITLLLGWIPHSVDRMLVLYREAMKRNAWPRGFFPLFTSGGGNYLLVNCRKDQPEYGHIFTYGCSKDPKGLIYNANSLTSMFEGALECHYKLTIYFKNGIRKEDQGRTVKIMKKFKVYGLYKLLLNDPI